MTDHEASRHWIEAASQGDAASIEALLQHHLPGLRLYLRRHAGNLVLGQESSSDLVQSICREVLDRLAQDRFEYRGEAEFKQWLYQAAILKIRDRQVYYKAQKRDVRRAWSPASDSLSSDPRYAEFFRSLFTPSREAIIREELERLEVAYQKLSEEHQEIIYLARIEGLRHKDIAARLGIGETASRKLLSRALARLSTLGRSS